MLKIYKSSIENHLHQFGYISYFDIWLLYKLNKPTELFFKGFVLFLKQILMSQWKVENLQHEMQVIMRQVNHHSPYQRPDQSSSKHVVVVYMIQEGKSLLI